MEPQIIVPDLQGVHNAQGRAKALKREFTYQDLSTIIIVPTRGKITDKVVMSWMNMVRPMNQKVIGPIMVRGLEVGAAYQNAIDMILNTPDLKDWKYVLVIEEDNMPPPDGMLKLYQAIEGGVDNVKYDSVCGLYWTKGEGGQPMVYGNPAEPLNFIPQVPRPETVQECHGTGLGFALLRLEMFRSGRIERPFFQTVQQPGRLYTQDLYFYEKARKAGFRIASDTRCKVGHYDYDRDIIW
jgi:hypothetical protein